VIRLDVVLDEAVDDLEHPAVDGFIGQKLRSETLLRIENANPQTGAPADSDPANLDRVMNADASLRTPDLGRFRINLHRQQGCAAAAIRVLPARVPAFRELNLPPSVESLAHLPRLTGGAQLRLPDFDLGRNNGFDFTRYPP
jgi:hypothetical protein